MRSLRGSRFMLLAMLAAAFVVVWASAASATYVPGAGFELSRTATATPVSGANFSPWHPELTDLNGDGITDVVCGGAVNIAGGVNILLGRPGGGYSAATTIPLGDSIPYLAVDDIDGDHVPDLVAAMSGICAWTMIGHGDGTFSQPTTITNSYGARDPHLVDCDNDGNKDLVTVGSLVTLRKGDGAGGFGSALLSTPTTSTMGNYGYAIDVADVNGDGLPDVAAADGLHGELRLFRGTGAAFAVAATASVDGTSASWPNDVAFVQLDSDARPEVLVTNRSTPGTGKLTAYDGMGPGFGYAPVWQASFTNGAEQVEVGDADGDGWDDVFVHENWTDKVTVFDNDGTGVLAERYSWTGQSGLNGFGVGDAGGDGRLDIIEAYGSSPGYFAIADNTLPPGVRRVFGPNRFATGAAASASAVTTSNAVVIATGSNFPDALSASGLCGALRAPLLLVGASVPESVTLEIQRLGATKAYIVGGSSSVSTAVFDALGAAPLSLDVTRVAGTDRFDTSRKVANEVMRLTATDGEVFVARGDLFPDALAAAPLAYRGRIPIVLTKPATLSPAADAALTDLDAAKVTIIGNAITAEVYDAIADRPGVVDATRVAGDDRYLTAAAVARYGVQRGLARWRFTYIATGTNFPDALSGGAAAGNLRGLLLLTAPGKLSGGAQTALHDNRDAIGEVRVLGGTSAVTDATMGQMRTAVQ